MATLADELLNDFEDSGDENDEQTNGFHDGDEADHADQQRFIPDQIEREGDEELMEDAEEELGAADSTAVEAANDEEETKAQVEKMRLGGIRDVRNVAGLMKTLEPVLEASPFPFCMLKLYSFTHPNIALTVSPFRRKFPTIKIYHPRNEPQRLDQSKTIPNTPF